MLVALHGLTSRPELNGSAGELLRYDRPARHWDVKVLSFSFEKNFIVAVSSADLALAPTLCPGAVAEVCGVERMPELNGQRCVLERLDGTSERWAVTFGNHPREHLLLLKPANLRATPPPPVNTHLTACVSAALELSCMGPPPGSDDLERGSMFLEMRLYLMCEEEEVTGGMRVLEVSAWPMATRRSVSIAILPWTPLAMGSFTPEEWAWSLALALNKANTEWRAAGRALRPLGGYGADRLFVRIDGGRLRPSDPLLCGALRAHLPLDCGRAHRRGAAVLLRAPGRRSCAHQLAARTRAPLARPGALLRRALVLAARGRAARLPPRGPLRTARVHLRRPERHRAWRALRGVRRGGRALRERARVHSQPAGRGGGCEPAGRCAPRRGGGSGGERAARCADGLSLPTWSLPSTTILIMRAQGVSDGRVSTAGLPSGWPPKPMGAEEARRRWAEAKPRRSPFPLRFLSAQTLSTLKRVQRAHALLTAELEGLGLGGAQPGSCTRCGASRAAGAGKLLFCPCRTVRYCSKNSQSAHWAEHKPRCPHRLVGRLLQLAPPGVPPAGRECICGPPNSPVPLASCRCGGRHDPEVLLSCARTGGEVGANALHTLADVTKHGMLGFPRSAEVSKLALVAAAEADHVPAMYDLGLAYWRGDSGLARDAERALHWWHRAADEFGDTCAAGSLGSEYLKGQVVPRDTARARKNFERVRDNPQAEHRELAIQSIRVIDMIAGGGVEL